MKSEAIRQWREEQGMSQAELARLLDVRRQTITEWETGVREVRMGRVLELALMALAAGMRIEDADDRADDRTD